MFNITVKVVSQRPVGVTPIYLSWTSNLVYLCCPHYLGLYSSPPHTHTSCIRSYYEFGYIFFTSSICNMWLTPTYLWLPYPCGSPCDLSRVQSLNSGELLWGSGCQRHGGGGCQRHRGGGRRGGGGLELIHAAGCGQRPLKE